MKKVLILIVMVAAMVMGVKVNTASTYYLDDAFGDVGVSSPVAT